MPAVLSDKPVRLVPCEMILEPFLRVKAGHTDIVTSTIRTEFRIGVCEGLLSENSTVEFDDIDVVVGFMIHHAESSFTDTREFHNELDRSVLFLEWFIYEFSNGYDPASIIFDLDTPGSRP